MFLILNIFEQNNYLLTYIFIYKYFKNKCNLLKILRYESSRIALNIYEAISLSNTQYKLLFNKLSLYIIGIKTELISVLCLNQY
jgi:hypothetical protein